MNNIVWEIPEEKRKQFENQYQNILESVQEDLWSNKDYMPYWYSDLPFPVFSKLFLNELPGEIQKKIKNIFNNVIK